MSALESLAGDVARVASTAWDGFLHAIESVTGTVLGWVRSIPGKIVGALGSLGGLLFNAGASIIGGLLHGLEHAFGGVMSFIGGVAGWIARHKGPLSYDSQLLIPHGIALMLGLRKGLEDSFATQVLPLVRSMAPRMQAELGALRLNQLAFAAPTVAGGFYPGAGGRPATITQILNVQGGQTAQQTALAIQRALAAQNRELQQRLIAL